MLCIAKGCSRAARADGFCGQPNCGRRAGVPKGEFCYGCGAISTGIHLDHALLPSDEPGAAP